MQTPSTTFACGRDLETAGYDPDIDGLRSLRRTFGQMSDGRDACDGGAPGRRCFWRVAMGGRPAREALSPEDQVAIDIAISIQQQEIMFSHLEEGRSWAAIGWRGCVC